MKSAAIFAGVFIVLMFMAAPSGAEDVAWTDRITLKGDVRLRHERIDEDGSEDRVRTRFRTRFGLSAKVSDDVDFVLRLATGGDSPVSTNQSFDGGFSTKDIGVDLAYVDWTINDNLTVYGGKMKNPLFRAGGVQLIWDGDLNPEGFAMKYTSGNFFGTVAGFSAEERSSADDSLVYAVQAGLKWPVADGASLTAGIGYFSYTDTIGNEPFFNGSANGNSVDASGNYIYDYENTELFAELSTTLGGWPFKVFAHATQNGDPGTEDTGFEVGAKLGSAKKDGEKEFSWTYKDVEADAVVGTFTDSDFGGGGTDADGHVLKAKYAVSKKIFLGGAFFLNTIDRTQGNERDSNRLQLDVEFKFD